MSNFSKRMVDFRKVLRGSRIWYNRHITRRGVDSYEKRTMNNRGDVNVAIN